MRLIHPPEASIRLGHTSQGPGAAAAAGGGAALPATGMDAALGWWLLLRCPPNPPGAGEGLLMALFEGRRVSSATEGAAPALPMATKAMAAAAHSHRSGLKGTGGKDGRY